MHEDDSSTDVKIIINDSRTSALGRDDFHLRYTRDQAVASVIITLAIITYNECASHTA